MSRVRIWLLLSLVGFAYWGVVHRFALSGIDHFSGPLWFGGMSLALHWFTNRAPIPHPLPAQANDGGEHG